MILIFLLITIVSANIDCDISIYRGLISLKQQPPCSYFMIENNQGYQLKLINSSTCEKHSSMSLQNCVGTINHDIQFKLTNYSFNIYSGYILTDLSRVEIQELEYKSEDQPINYIYIIGVIISVILSSFTFIISIINGCCICYKIRISKYKFPQHVYESINDLQVIGKRIAAAHENS